MSEQAKRVANGSLGSVLCLLHEKSRDLTAFIYMKDYRFKFCRVPWSGLASGSSAFQKMLATMLKGLPNASHDETLLLLLAAIDAGKPNF